MRAFWPTTGVPRTLCALVVGLAYLLPSPAAAQDEPEPKALFLAGNYAECIAAAAAELAEDDESERLYLLKIKSEMELGRYGEALKTLDVALAKIPTSLKLRWEGRAVCHFNGQSERALQLDKETATLLKNAPWIYSDVANQIIVGRLMLSQGIDPKRVLNTIYNEAKRRQPNNVDLLIAAGDLALDKHDYQLAGDSYQAAVKADPQHAEALLGVARAFEPSDSEKTQAMLAAALKANPRFVPALLFVVDHHIDSERYDDADKVLAQIAAVNPHHPDALAYRAVLAHLRNQPEEEKTQRAGALKHWAGNPAVDHLIGRKLSQKYRFSEGEAYQRQALKFSPQYLPAKSQLAQDLLRLGREAEGMKLATEVYDADAYNILAHNLVTLEESLAKFRTLEADGIMVRMDAREAEIYGNRVLELLQRAKRELAAKYEVELKQPIVVELFPRQQDFAIRTFGMPGGAGFLGVCFGTVITANSPASQTTTPACWEATLWHEFCHVITLNKTNNKMPRWLSEGISVFEERQADATWGQTMTPRYREMILGDDLTPVSELSGAFLRPQSPLHLQFAYYESSLVVEYLVEKHGLDILKRVLVDLGVGMPINESLGRYTGSIEALDKEFADYARSKAKALAPDADWAAPELPRRASSEQIAAWLKDHPHNYPALARLAQQYITEKKWPEAKEILGKMRKLYPHDTSAAGALKQLAHVYKQTEENSQERAVLEALAALSDDDVEVFARLSALAAEASDWELTRKIALRWLAVNPLGPEPHRRAAAAAVALDDRPLAIASYRALLQLQPFDPAAVHFQLAEALHKQGDDADAKRHVLMALEEAPRYRAAQELLLKLASPAEPAP